jgi:hypothetical protein
MLSSSGYAAEYFSGACRQIPCDLLEPQRHSQESLEQIDEFRPDSVVFDTRWPPELPTLLARRGVKRVLVLRAMALDRMQTLVPSARDSFDRILLPHTMDELEFYYGGTPKLIKTLFAPPFLVAGPLARVTDQPANEAAVIFTLGAGAPYLVPVADGDDIRSQLLEFVRASEILSRDGYRDLRLIVGPYLKITDETGHLTPIQSPRAFQEFGPRACVVSRGGYNTCWEAIGARSHLVIQSGQRLVENVEARMHYLVNREFARTAGMKAQEIVEAIKMSHAPKVDIGAHQVNRSLDLAVRAITD